MRFTLFTLTGLPYAGKTTLRQALIKLFDLEVISIDELNTQNNVGIDPNKLITQNDWDRAYTQAYNLLKQYLHEGKSVVFDGGSLLFHERETQRKIAQELGANVKLIYVKTPIEVIKQRREKM